MTTAKESVEDWMLLVLQELDKLGSIPDSRQLASDAGTLLGALKSLASRSVSFPWPPMFA